MVQFHFMKTMDAAYDPMGINVVVRFTDPSRVITVGLIGTADEARSALETADDMLKTRQIRAEAKKYGGTDPYMSAMMAVSVYDMVMNGERSQERVGFGLGFAMWIARKTDRVPEPGYLLSINLREIHKDGQVYISVDVYLRDTAGVKELRMLADSMAEIDSKPVDAALH